jgi:hypothetical protein
MVVLVVPAALAPVVERRILVPVDTEAVQVVLARTAVVVVALSPSLNFVLELYGNVGGMTEMK